MKVQTKTRVTSRSIHFSYDFNMIEPSHPSLEQGTIQAMAPMAARSRRREIVKKTIPIDASATNRGQALPRPAAQRNKEPWPVSHCAIIRDQHHLPDRSRHDLKIFL